MQNSSNKINKGILLLERIFFVSQFYRFKLMIVLVGHFFLSLHHEWIERRLRVYERARLLE